MRRFVTIFSVTSWSTLSAQVLVLVCRAEREIRSDRQTLTENTPEVSQSRRTALLWHRKKKGWTKQTYEPAHDKKITKLHVRPAKTQISLGICPVWSESSLSAWRTAGSLAIHWAHNKDSGHTELMPRLIWVFAGRTCHFVGFATYWFI